MARHFENWLRAYMAYTADSESPDSFHFWTGVSTLAGALRRRVWVEMRKFQWTPNFYIVLVGPPGIATKSTSIRTGMKLLEQIADIRFGPQSMTWQALADALSESMFHMPDPRGIEGKFIPMSCLTIPVSELGTFLKVEDKVLIDVLVDLWDGQLSTWSHKIRASSVEIKNPWLNVIGCTTPAWLQSNVPEQLIGGGLTSRIVFVYGEAKRHLVAYPDEHMHEKEYYEIEAKLVDDLREVASLSGPYVLTPSAREWGRAWYEKHWNGGKPLHLASPRYEGYYSRKQAHMHKLAMVLAAARSNELVLTEEHLQEALALLDSAEPHMLKVFESVGMSEESRHANTLIPFVRIHGWMTSNALWRCAQNMMSMREFEEALRGAVRAGSLVIERREGQSGVKLPETLH